MRNPTGDYDYWYWGLVGPHALVVSLIGSKVLEVVPKIYENTYAHVYDAVRGLYYLDIFPPRDDDKRAISEVSLLIERKQLDEVVAAGSPIKNIDGLLEFFGSNNITIHDARAILKEVKAGRIESTPTVEGFLRQEEAHWRAQMGMSLESRPRL